MKTLDSDRADGFAAIRIAFSIGGLFAEGHTHVDVRRSQACYEESEAEHQGKSAVRPNVRVVQAEICYHLSAADSLSDFMSTSG